MAFLVEGEGERARGREGVKLRVRVRGVRRRVRTKNNCEGGVQNRGKVDVCEGMKV